MLTIPGQGAVGHSEKDLLLHEEIREMIIKRPVLSQPIKSSRPELEVHHESITHSQRSMENFTLTNTEIAAGLPDFLLEQTATSLAGVELLNDSDKIQLKRLKTGFEALNRYRNKFEILNESGQRILLAAEITNVDLTKHIWLRNRGIIPQFTVSIMNCSGEQILSLYGQPGICNGQNSMRVFSGSALLGSMEQGDDYGSTTYSVRDRNNKKIFNVTGPLGGCCGRKIPIHSKIEFNITTESDSEFIVARVSKTPSFVTDGKLPELFGIAFALKPLDLGVKLLLISTLIFLQFDFIKFDERDGPRANEHINLG